MTEYGLPAEPTGPLWMTRPTGATTRWHRDDESPRGPWCSTDDPMSRLYWGELLATPGKLSDVHPVLGALAHDPTPWRVSDSNPGRIVDAAGEPVTSADADLAPLIVRAVNELAERETAPTPVPAPAVVEDGIVPLPWRAGPAGISAADGSPVVYALARATGADDLRHMEFIVDSVNELAEYKREIRALLDPVSASSERVALRALRARMDGS